MRPSINFATGRANDYVDFDLGVLADITRFPMRLQCEQFKITRVIVAMLAEYPHAEVRLGVEVTGVSNDADGGGVTVEAARPGRQRRRASAARSRYACDGASSTVRKLLGIEFEGFTWPEKFLSIGSPLDYTEYLPGLSNVSYISDPDEWCALVRVVGSWRIVFPTDPDSRRRTTLLSDAQRRPADAQVLADPRRVRDLPSRDLPRAPARRRNVQPRPRAAGGRCRAPEQPARRDGHEQRHSRCVQRLREDRARAARAAKTSQPLLDHYTRQRRMVAVEYVQAASIRNKKLLEERDPAVRRERFEELRAIASDPVQAREYLRRSTLYESLERANAVAMSERRRRRQCLDMDAHRTPSEERFFQQRGFGLELGFGEHPALLVIDLMKAFTDSSNPLGANLDRANRRDRTGLLDAAHAAGFPVLLFDVSVRRARLRATPASGARR